MNAMCAMIFSFLLAVGGLPGGLNEYLDDEVQGAPQKYALVYCSARGADDSTVAYAAERSRLTLCDTAADGDALPPADDAEALRAAMQRDIDLLKAQNNEQTYSDEYYAGLKEKPMLTIVSVTGEAIQLSGAPQAFSGNYTGRFTTDRSYPYYQTADMGGKRYYTVKDNFGVWITFKYVVPIG